MPGIVGCAKSCGTVKEVELAISDLTYSDDYRKDDFFKDKNIYCSRTHKNIIGEKRSPILNNTTYCWIEGEFYNTKELNEVIGRSDYSDGNLLLEAYHQNILEKVLEKADGIFVAIIYDQDKDQILFISDRLGLKPLYIWSENQKIIWSSELKALLRFNKFNRVVDVKNLECICRIGHFMGDGTYFENTQLIGPSSIYCYSLSKREFIFKRKYWKWNKIKKIDISLEEAINRISILFRKAIENRISPTLKSGLALSGGIDSRAIFAFLSQDIDTITFGLKNSEDVEIAKNVSGTRQVKNIFYDINESNWINGRIESIWKSDGSINFLHLHGSQFHETIGKNYKIIFSGFAGNSLLEGRYISNCNNRISNVTANLKYQDYYKLDPPMNDYYDVQSENPYHINNWERRFIYSSINEIKHFECRFPIVDNNLVEFLISLDEKLITKSKLYHKFLLKSHPDLFLKIPRQGKGLPISNESILDHLLKKFIYLANVKTGRIKRNMTDYRKWICNKNKKMDNMLSKNESILYQIINDNSLLKPQSYLHKAMLFTIEVWLQLSLNNKDVNMIDW